MNKKAKDLLVFERDIAGAEINFLVSKMEKSIFGTKIGKSISGTGNGKIIYGKIEVEDGGKLIGEINYRDKDNKQEEFKDWKAL